LCKKHESSSLHDLFSSERHLLGVSFITIPKSNVCTPRSTQNTTINERIIVLAQKASALHSSVVLTGIHLLLATSKGRSTFRSIKSAKVNCELHSQYLYSALELAIFPLDVCSGLVRRHASNLAILELY